jgi:hypothetical protein
MSSYDWRRPTKIGVKRGYYFFSLIPFGDKVARQKILSTSWNVQFVVFNTSEKLNNNLVNA